VGGALAVLVPKTTWPQSMKFGAQGTPSGLVLGWEHPPRVLVAILLCVHRVAPGRLGKETTTRATREMFSGPKPLPGEPAKAKIVLSFFLHLDPIPQSNL
jgi:hypothetical protein